MYMQNIKKQARFARNRVSVSGFMLRVHLCQCRSGRHSAQSFCGSMRP